MNIITTEQLVGICIKATRDYWVKPVCGAARLGENEDPLAFAEALFRCPVGEYVHISHGAMGQDDYMKLAAQGDDGLPLWETQPQQCEDPDEWAAEMLRHHG